MKGDRGWSGPERRGASRVPVTLPAELEIGGRRLLGAIRDLSPQGAYVELIDRERGGVIPEEGSLAAPVLGGACRVSVRSIRRVDGCVTGVGLELLELSDEARSAIAARLAALDVRPAKP